MGTGTIVPGAFHPTLAYTTSSSGTITAKVTFTGTPTIPAAGGFSYTYKWLRDGVTISGQTASSYKLTSADTGKLVTVVVKLSKSGFSSLTLAAVQVNTIKAGEQPTAQVDGANASTATEGNLLSVVVPLYYLQKDYPGGDYLLSPDITYQWFYEDSSEIVGATASTYLVTASDAGRGVYVKITVNAPYHASVADASNMITIT